MFTISEFFLPCAISHYKGCVARAHNGAHDIQSIYQEDLGYGYIDRLYEPVHTGPQEQGEMMQCLSWCFKPR